MTVDVKYTAEATATGGRDGRASTTDGTFEVKLATPKELGGGGGEGNNPEQLFAAGYSACFLGAVKAVARKAGVKISDDATVAADVGIGPIPTGFALKVELTVTLPGIDRSSAQKLVEDAHIVCPYSNATRHNVAVTIKVA